MNWQWAAAIMVVCGALTAMVDTWTGNNLAYKVSYMAIALMNLLVAYTLIPAIREKSPLALGLALMNLSSFGIYGWWWLHNFMNRPKWFIEDQYWIFLFAAGSLVGSVGSHLTALGAAQGKQRLYLSLFAAIVALSLAFNILQARQTVLP